MLTLRLQRSKPSTTRSRRTFLSHAVIIVNKKPRPLKRFEEAVTPSLPFGLTITWLAVAAWKEMPPIKVALLNPLRANADSVGASSRTLMFDSGHFFRDPLSRDRIGKYIPPRARAVLTTAAFSRAQNSTIR